MRGELRQVGRERAVGVRARQIAEQIEARLGARKGEAGKEARRFAPFPKRAGVPHRIVLEHGVGRGIDVGELRVKIVDYAPHFGKLAVDLALEELHVRRKIDAPIVQKELHHRIERHGAPAEGLRLGELREHAFPRGRRGEQHGEGAAPENVPPVLVRRRTLTLPEHEHTEIAPRQERRGHERADRSAEHDDVVVLVGQSRVSPNRRAARSPILTRGRMPFDPGTTVTSPSAMAAMAATRSRCSSCKMRAVSVSSVSPSNTGTTRWAMMGPVSVPVSTKCTVQPATFTPYSSAWRCAWTPGNAGKSAGWMLMTRHGNASRNPAVRTRMKPASTT